MMSLIKCQINKYYLPFPRIQVFETTILPSAFPDWVVLSFLPLFFLSKIIEIRVSCVGSYHRKVYLGVYRLSVICSVWVVLRSRLRSPTFELKVFGLSVHL